MENDDLTQPWTTGIYLIRWLSGGASLAAVQVDVSGRIYVYPTNWLSHPNAPPVPWQEERAAKDVRRVVLLAQSPDDLVGLPHVGARLAAPATTTAEMVPHITAVMLDMQRRVEAAAQVKTGIRGSIKTSLQAISVMNLLVDIYQIGEDSE